MKKIFTFFFLLFAAFSATASNYFTIFEAVNDTLRINPTYLNGYKIVTFGAHFDGYLDSWRLDLTYPQMNVMRVMYIGRGSDMNIPYLQSDGTEDVYQATLTITPHYDNIYYDGAVTVSSVTNVYGYWDPDNDGIYTSYGTVKWGAGDYSGLFHIDYMVNDDCTGDSIVIDGHLTSTPDLRGDTINTDFVKKIYLKLAYLFGDINGDEVVNIADVTALMNYVLTNGDWFDQYQFDAADVNGDGEINLSDVTILVSWVLVEGTDSIEDINEILPNLFDS